MKTISVGINVSNHLLDDSEDTRYKVRKELAQKVAEQIVEHLKVEVSEHTFDTDFSVTFSYDDERKRK